MEEIAELLGELSKSEFLEEIIIPLGIPVEVCKETLLGVKTARSSFAI